MAGKFTYTLDRDGQYRFRLLACNGQAILTSRSYRDRRACLAGIEAVRANSPDAANFAPQPPVDGRFHFVLKAANGAVLGTSLGYASHAGCHRGVASVQRHVAEAVVVQR